MPTVTIVRRTAHAPAPLDEASRSPADVWLVGQTPGQFQRRGRYLVESNRHPAKMLPSLARRIIEAYSRPGDLVLDPMSGIGTTGVEAVELGRHYVGVELEDGFVAWQRANLELASGRGATGRWWLARGDARRLDALLREETWVASHVPSSRRCERAPQLPPASLVAVSPPYGESALGSPRSPRLVALSRLASGRRVTERDLARAPSERDLQRYSDDLRDRTNLANLPYGAVDLVATSPPYADMALDHGLTSGLHFDRDPDAVEIKRARERHHSPRYSSNPRNIGNHRYGAGDRARASTPTYLGEMLAVYRQCHAALRPGGFLVAVVKDFRRNGALVNLGGDTVRLCQAAGFVLYQHVVAVLAKFDDQDWAALRTSFWQLLQTRHARARGEPRAIGQYEHVLVFRKPEDGETG